MLAHRIQFYILHNDHFIIIFLELSRIQDFSCIQLVAMRQVLHRLSHALWCFL
ncbi:hypothetical protein D9M68_885370 [compost metagenome]